MSTVSQLLRLCFNAALFCVKFPGVFTFPKSTRLSCDLPRQKLVRMWRQDDMLGDLNQYADFYAKQVENWTQQHPESDTKPFQCYRSLKNFNSKHDLDWRGSAFEFRFSDDYYRDKLPSDSKYGNNYSEIYLTEIDRVQSSHTLPHSKRKYLIDARNHETHNNSPDFLSNLLYSSNSVPRSRGLYEYSHPQSPQSKVFFVKNCRNDVILRLCSLLRQPPNASFNDLRYKYRMEVKKCHPDTLADIENPIRAVARFRAITEAWKLALPALQREIS